MINRNSKIAFLFGFYIVLHFAEACCDNNELNCICPNSFPFFDYGALKITTPSNSVFNYFSLEISADSITYLATTHKKSGFGLINSAWACDCVWNGHDGPKYLTEKFNIYANRAFNDTLPAGTSLNPIFLGDGGDVLITLKADEPFEYFWAFGEGAENIRPIELLTFEKPEDLEVPFIFRIEIIKASGDTLHAETEEIIFH